MISQYTRPEYRLCSLDVVNLAAYLAFIDKETALKIKFSPESLFAIR